MKIVFVFLVLVTFVGISCAKRKVRGCVRQTWSGCKVKRNGRCHCGRSTRCRNPFVYASKKECMKLNHDICTTLHPCKNGGVCMNHGKTSHRCLCSGTGYYGDNCETACPAPNRRSSTFWKFPTDCVEI